MDVNIQRLFSYIYVPNWGEKTILLLSGRKTLSLLVLKLFYLKYVLYGEKMYTVFCDIS